ncbi:fibronectin type III domain-containing protein [Bacillus cereus group sp. Sample30]|uniref:fibronectin type III domain-containing protein n=1 Tax=Bacillus cereus group sp. Sample30 TaxID=2816449 RepID=UPI002FDC6457
MRIKKCFAIFSLMMIMCLSVLPSFASADSNDLFEGIVAVDNKGKKYPEITDGNLNTYSVIQPQTTSSERVLFDFGKKAKPKMVTYKFNKPVPNDSLYFTLVALPYTDVITVNLKKGELEGSLDLTSYYNSNQSLKNGVDGFALRYYGSVPLEISDMKLLANLPVSEISDLNAVEGVNDVNFTWKNPTDEKFTGVSIYKENEFLKTVNKSENSYKVEGLEANKNYNFKFVAIYGDEKSQGIQKGVKTLIDPKTIPPSPVSSLTAEPTDKTVKLKWKKPKDEDLAGFKILQNGKQVAEIGLEEEFTVKNLQPLTDYTFGVMAFDRDKNDSSPVNLSVKTLEEKDEEPPHVPTNVFAKPSNGALIASWDKVSDKDLAGYNVYVDDKKINSNLVSSTNFTIKNLENNRKYKIQVQAVDRSGNASALSLAAYGTPDERTLPIIESKYSLQDVSDGVGVMFGQFWTVLAFAVGIPLAFYIIYKLKLTVLP